MRVAAINDDVARFEMRHYGVDHVVDGVAGLDHQHHPAGLLERADELFDGVCADDLRALRFVVNEVVYFRNCSVEDSDFVAMVVHIQNQVLSHDRKADQSDVAICVLHTPSLISKSKIEKRA